jgi:hypothetical protein
LETGTSSWESIFVNPLRRAYYASISGMKSSPYRYDVFISHAVEDKMPIANELWQRLEGAGIKVWYSGRELRVGDRVSDTIVEGLDQCRFGIVILSPTYISKMWPLREFYILLTREKNEQKVVLPILYDITPEELAQKDLTMANIYALRADKGMDYLIATLVPEIRKQQVQDVAKAIAFTPARLWRIGIVTVIVAIIGVLAYLNWSQHKKFTPGMEDVRKGIQGRIGQMEKEVLQTLQEKQFKVPVTHDAVVATANEFSKLKTYYRNEFHLDYLDEDIHNKKNVQAALFLSLDTVSVLNHFTFDNPEIYEPIPSMKESRKSEYVFVNPAPVEFTLGDLEKVNDDTYRVSVKYRNNIRLVHSIYNFPESPKRTKETLKRYEVIIHALMPEERFIVERHSGAWQCRIDQ